MINKYLTIPFVQNKSQTHAQIKPKQTHKSSKYENHKQSNHHSKNSEQKYKYTKKKIKTQKSYNIKSTKNCLRL